MNGVVVVEERKRRVLQAIVDDYIATAEPVGSRTIAPKYGLGVSSATIRNEMADLEELGYLEQPHTSAGRIPSDAGYRYYINHLMARQAVKEEWAHRLREKLETKARQMSDLIHQTTHILAEMTQSLTLMTAPQAHGTAFRHLQVMPLSEGKALLLVISGEGLVHNRQIDVPEGILAEELEAISKAITQRFSGQPYDSIVASRAMKELIRELSRYQSVVDLVLDTLTSMSEQKEEQVFLGGATYILRNPEFRDVEKIEQILELMETQDLIRQLLRHNQGTEQGDLSVRVGIGAELELHAVQDCSLVTATYLFNGQPVGSVGVLGPRRMDYGRIIALVDMVRLSLSDILSH